MGTFEDTVLNGQDFLPLSDSRNLAIFGLPANYEVVGDVVVIQDNTGAAEVVFSSLPAGFAAVEELTVRRDGAAPKNGFIAGTDGVEIRWKYPVVGAAASGSSPLNSAVAYEVRIMAGEFSGEELNTLESLGLDCKGQCVESRENDFLRVTGASSYLSKAQAFPGEVVFEEFLNFDDPIKMFDPNAKVASVSVPDGVLEEGQVYTVAVRLVVYDSRLDPQVVVEDGGSWEILPRPFYGLTQYQGFNFSVVQSEIGITNLRVSGQVNPKLPQGKLPIFSFDLNSVGPELLYAVSIGTTSGDNYNPSIYDSGFVQSPVSSGKFIPINIPYAGPSLSRGVDYYWRAYADNGLSLISTSDGNDSFRINSPPTVTSLKANGNELLLGAVPVVSGSIVLTWEFEDLDDDDQTAYRIVVKSGAETVVDTGVVSAGSQTATLSSLSGYQDVSIFLSLKDDMEFGPEATGSFRIDNSPVLSTLTIDGEENPTALASATPTIGWEYSDVERSSQAAFQIQVATDDEFEDLVWDTGAVSSASTSVVYGSTGSPVVAPAALAHGDLYHIRVRASDGSSFSDYITGFFAVNSAPGDPVLLTPSSGAYSGTLSITWLPASPVDDDGDDVTYTLEITDTRSLNRGWSLVAGPLDSSETSYDLDLSQFPAGDNYGIRIIASDGFSESNPLSGGTSSRFEISNHAPTSPTFLLPEAGQTVSRTLRAQWSEADPVDVDGDSVTYSLEITPNASDDVPNWSLLGVFPQGRIETFVDVTRFEDGDDFRLRITATDSNGESGAAALSGVFSVSNALTIKDFERLNGTLYLAASDGRIFKAQDTIWQVDEDWSEQSNPASFEIFERNNPQALIANGRLVIKPVPGSTYLLRHSDDLGK